MGFGSSRVASPVSLDLSASFARSSVRIKRERERENTDAVILLASSRSRRDETSSWRLKIFEEKDDSFAFLCRGAKEKRDARDVGDRFGTFWR